MRYILLAVLGTGLIGASSPLRAQTDTAAEIAALRGQIEALMARLERLEQSAVTAADSSTTALDVPIPPAEPASSWTDRVRLSGDLRYRHETINDDSLSVRHRHRIRARANVTAEVAENMTMGFGLSTGGIANDSGNQTLDSGFSRKDIGLDLAYFNWGLGDDLNLVAGKMSNPFFRPAGYHLIYDGDLRTEGLALRYRSGSLFGNASAFWVEERSSGPDSMLFGLQGGYRGTLDNGVGLTAGVSYYETTHTQGRAPIFTPGSGQGNQLDANGNYLYGFSEIELFGELRFDVSGQPLTVFADYVTNTDADAFDEGFAAGAIYRRASVPGDWTVAYIYQDLEANAVVGAFTDSDFAGGTSDGSGHTLRAGYVFPGGWNFALRYIIGDRGEAAGNKRDYNRLQADISVRY
jgi:hypothetical protein